MSRYIDLEEAIKSVHGVMLDFFDYVDDGFEEPMTYKEKQFLSINKKITTALKELPTADVVERKTGKWKCICSTDYWQYTYEHYRCSECGIPTECAFRYCPNCGAEMRNAETEV